MSRTDEPLFPMPGDKIESAAAAASVMRESIRRSVEEQPYAVLCVQGAGQPYGVLVAFAFSKDLRHAVFVTPVATRKYRLLTECVRRPLVKT